MFQRIVYQVRGSWVSLEHFSRAVASHPQWLSPKKVRPLKDPIMFAWFQGEDLEDIIKANLSRASLNDLLEELKASQQHRNEESAFSFAVDMNDISPAHVKFFVD